MEAHKGKLLDSVIAKSKIAIIDDEIVSLSAAIRALKEHGFNNLIKIKKITSLKDILIANFDLVVLDIAGVLSADLSEERASKSDGLVVLNYLKDRDPTLAVVLLTGATYSITDVETLKRADGFIGKPVSSARLIRAVEDVLVLHHDPMYQAKRAVEGIRALVMDNSALSARTRFRVLRKSDKLLSADSMSADGVMKFLQGTEKYVGSTYYSSKVIAMLGELFS